MAKRRIETLRLDRFVVVNHRIAGGGPHERRLGDRPARERVEQRRLADASAAHEHHDQQRLVDIDRGSLSAKIVKHPLQRCLGDHWQRLAMRPLKPAAHIAFQRVEQGGQRPEQGFGRVRGGFAAHAGFPAISVLMLSI